MTDAPEEGFEDITVTLVDNDGTETETEVELNLDLADDEPEEADDDISLDFSTDEEDAEAEEAEDAASAAVAELREELRTKPGDWYVVHTYSGMENRVKQNIDARVQTLNMEDYIFETIVPTEEVVEIRNSVRKTVTRTVAPGYVLVRMDLTDDSWSAIRHTPSVTGFVGHANTPIPLDLDEVEKLLSRAVIAKANATGAPSSRRKKVEVADFNVGDSVMVVDGPFAGVHATLTEIHAHSQRVKALVDFMGRETPVELTFNQIQKA